MMKESWVGQRRRRRQATSSNRTKDDGKLRHHSDGKQWKDFNATFLEFGKEARNVSSR